MPPADVDAIDALLAGTYVDPETGDALRAEARSVIIEESLDGREAELVAALDVGARFAVVSDTVTHAVLGARVERALASRFHVQSIVLSAPRADSETVARVAAGLEHGIDALIAVGTGTLNDVTKMVAHQRGVPQMVFATAPSMNGFTSLSSSITTDGVKRSYRTRTPIGAFFDLRVLAAAPLRLIRAGLGDSACRPTAHADWLLSRFLLDTPYKETPFVLLDGDEEALYSQTRALVEGDIAVMRHLVRTLVLSGFGMTICNGSYPASQGEHLLSHYIEMMQPRAATSKFHGEQIAVCTVAMAEIQEQLLRRPTLELRPSTVTREQVIEHFGPVIGEACWREYEDKRLDGTRLDEVNARLAKGWDWIRTDIQHIVLGADVHRELLEAAGAPVKPSQLGWSTELFSHALDHAREIRNRYTFLDVAADLATMRD